MWDVEIEECVGYESGDVERVGREVSEAGRGRMDVRDRWEEGGWWEEGEGGRCRRGW